MMKIIFITCASLIVLPLTIFSQPYSIGIRIGFINTEIIHNPSWNTNRENDFYSGLFVEREISKNLSMQVGLDYEEKSFVNNIVSLDIYNVYNGKPVPFNFKYLTLPIILKPTIGDKIKIYGNLGLYGSYLLDAETKEVYPISNNKSIMIYTNLTNKIDKADFGLILGFGAEYPVIKGFVLGFDTRYNQSLHSIDGKGNFGSASLINNSVNFSLKIRYILNSKNI